MGVFGLTKLNVSAHFLVPKHALLEEKEIKKLLETYTITKKDLPRIKNNDPGIANLDAEIGDIIKVERDSKLGGKVYYYRLVE